MGLDFFNTRIGMYLLSMIIGIVILVITTSIAPVATILGTLLLPIQIIALLVVLLFAGVIIVRTLILLFSRT